MEVNWNEIKSQAEYKKVINDLVLEQIKSPKKFKDFLTYYQGVEKLGNLNRYSFKNRMLVYAQKPDAMLLKTFNQWNKLGIKINGGEVGLRLFSYFKNCKDQEHQKNMDICGNCPKSYLSFKKVIVFDISQTNQYNKFKNDLEKVQAIKNHNYTDYDNLLNFLQKHSGANFDYKEYYANNKIYGFTDGKTINVANNINHEETKKTTLLHEFGHMVLGHNKNHFDGKTISRDVKEVDAENFALLSYLLTHDLKNITKEQKETIDNSIVYITNWYKEAIGKKDYKITKDFDKVFSNVRTYIANNLEFLNKERALNINQTKTLFYQWEKTEELER